jgi:hypothetical protein
MPPTSYPVSRRSQRVSLALPVLVCGESPKRKPFREEALTVAFNAHGALLILHARIELGQKLLLVNPKTRDEQEARVMYFTPASGGLAHVGVEFMRPAPEFWPIINLPDDWKNAPIATQNSVSLRTC